jgi:hypothetical protein
VHLVGFIIRSITYCDDWLGMKIIDLAVRFHCQFTNEGLNVKFEAQSVFS